MSAKDRGWGNGFPANRVKDMQPVEVAGVKVSVNRAIAPLVRFLMEETERRGYHLKAGQCWGYANRAIRGSKTNAPSNHSWGLAIDINAPSNPQTDKLVTDMPDWMPKLWKEWGFGWGGDYKPPTKKDAMHYEFTGTPDDARRLIHKLEEAQRPAAVAPPVTMEVVPMYNPPIEISSPVVATLKASGGGLWMLCENGAIYAWECMDHGAPNRHPEYWVNRRAARLEPLGAGYAVVDSTGSRYEYP